MPKKVIARMFSADGHTITVLRQHRLWPWSYRIICTDRAGDPCGFIANTCLQNRALLLANVHAGKHVARSERLVQSADQLRQRVADGDEIAGRDIPK